MTDVKAIPFEAALRVRSGQRSASRAQGEAARLSKEPVTIAVDFDGCLCEDAYPEIGKAHQSVIDELLRRQKEGCELILWTCREGWLLAEAVGWCKAHDLRFDAVNANSPRLVAKFGNDCRKVGADEYWDDRAVVINRSGRFVRSY
jgi:hypothetical protein